MASFDDLDLLSLRTLMSYIPLHERLKLRCLNQKCLQAIDLIPVHTVRAFVYTLPCKRTMEINDIFLSRYYPFWNLNMFAYVRHLAIYGKVRRLDLSSLKHLTTLELKIVDEPLMRLFQEPLPSVKRLFYNDGLASFDELRLFPNLEELSLCGIKLDQDSNVVFSKIEKLTILVALDNDSTEASVVNCEIQAIVSKFPNIRWLSIVAPHIKDIANLVNNLPHLEFVQVQDNYWALKLHSWLQCNDNVIPTFNRKVKVQFMFKALIFNYVIDEIDQENDVKRNILLFKQMVQQLAPFFDQIYFYDWCLTTSTFWPVELEQMLTLIKNEDTINQYNVEQLEKTSSNLLRFYNQLMDREIINLKVNYAIFTTANFRYMHKLRDLTLTIDKPCDFALNADQLPNLTSLSIGCNVNQPIDFTSLTNLKQLTSLVLFNIDFSPRFILLLLRSLPTLNDFTVYDKNNVTYNMSAIVKFIVQKASENRDIQFRYLFSSQYSYMRLNSDLLRNRTENLYYIQNEDFMQFQLRRFVYSSHLL